MFVNDYKMDDIICADMVQLRIISADMGKFTGILSLYVLFLHLKWKLHPSWSSNPNDRA